MLSLNQELIDKVATLKFDGTDLSSRPLLNAALRSCLDGDLNKYVASYLSNIEPDESHTYVNEYINESNDDDSTSDLTWIIKHCLILLVNFLLALLLEFITSRLMKTFAPDLVVRLERRTGSLEATRNLILIGYFLGGWALSFLLSRS